MLFELLYQLREHFFAPGQESAHLVFGIGVLGREGPGGRGETDGKQESQAHNPSGRSDDGGSYRAARMRQGRPSGCPTHSSPEQQSTLPVPQKSSRRIRPAPGHIHGPDLWLE